MIRYVFREAPVLIKNAKDADPQAIGEALMTISEKNGGRLTPAATVEESRPRDAPLHRHFEWVNRIAADKYRLDQARQIIRAVRIIDDDDDVAEPKIAFLSVAEAPNGFAYVTRDAVVTSRHFQEIVLRQAEKDLAAWERRYAELHDLCEEVRRIRTALAARRARALDERRGGEAHP